MGYEPLFPGGAPMMITFALAALLGYVLGQVVASDVPRLVRWALHR